MNIISNTEIEEAVTALETSSQEVTTSAAVDFCTAWPLAKQVLTFLATLPQLKWIVPIVIVIGDAYFAKKCGR